MDIIDGIIDILELSSRFPRGPREPLFVNFATPKKVGKNYVDMDTYVRTLDRERIRLITKLKVSCFFIS